MMLPYLIYLLRCRPRVEHGGVGGSTLALVPPNIKVGDSVGHVAHWGASRGQGADLGLGLVGPSRSAVELGLKVGEFTRDLLALGAPPRLKDLHFGRMSLRMSLEGGRRPQLPH